MASVALLVGGAILNAAAFTGGNYLAKYLSGDSDAPEKALAEKKRHDLALEKFQKDVQKYREEREAYQDFLHNRNIEKEKALYGLKQTDKNFALYAKFHGGEKPMSRPRWGDYYQPSEQQKNGELAFIGAGAIAVGYGVSRFI